MNTQGVALNHLYVVCRSLVLALFLTGGVALCQTEEEYRNFSQQQPTACEMPEESILEQGSRSALQFLITLSGTVHNERFDGVRAILTLSIPPDASLNPYLLTVEGFPQRNSQNTFFWNSEPTSMSALGSTIVSELKPSVGIAGGIHFFFLSPALLEKRVFMTQLEKQRKAKAEAVAQPTKIFAQTGKITVSIQETTISGTVVMTGYDAIEHSYVTYSAAFNGMKTSRLKPKEELKK